MPTPGTVQYHVDLMVSLMALAEQRLPSKQFAKEVDKVANHYKRLGPRLQGEFAYQWTNRLLTLPE